ncbi:SIR2 family protein [Zooshikella sp. RANM57]|uniref:SIR2 family protein n=1 Tax=Zooshikella sp. RANM57 TaxID=3425863 RepID=UPI003D6FFC63
MDKFISLIGTGKSVLFVGAGFSRGACNIENVEPFLSKELAAEICELGGFDVDHDLRFAADYYLSFNEKLKLIDLLKRIYTIKKVSVDHVSICRANWRRFYTTNYDKCIELASQEAGKIVETIDISFSTSEYYKRDNLCIHLNGSIDSLTEDSLENGFKLSTSSYISSDSFIKSDWFYYFKKDLERSYAIVFVGYSMYDIEVQKILFENDALREKTYFITSCDIDKKQDFTLSKFGNVVSIGVSGFAKLLTDNSDLIEHYREEVELQAFNLYEISEEEKNIRDFDVEKMILYGDFSDTLIDNGVTQNQRIPNLIIREDIYTICNFIENNKNVIVYSELGNGKTILLKELKSVLAINSFEVYDVLDKDGDYIGDIDILAKIGRRIVLKIDGYEPYLDLFEHYIYSMPSNINIVASARTSEHERLRSELKKMEFSFNELCIDRLSEKESSFLLILLII